MAAGLPGEGQGKGPHPVAGKHQLAGVVEDVGRAGAIAAHGATAAAAHGEELEGSFGGELPVGAPGEAAAQAGAGGIPVVGWLAGPAGDRRKQRVVGVGVGERQQQRSGEAHIGAEAVVLVAAAACGTAAGGAHLLEAELGQAFIQEPGGGQGA